MVDPASRRRPDRLRRGRDVARREHPAPLMAHSTSAQYSLTIRLRIPHRPGMLGRVATAIGEAGGTIGAIDLISLDARHPLRDVTVDATSADHLTAILDAIRAVGVVEVVDSTDRTLL